MGPSILRAAKVFSQYHGHHNHAVDLPREPKELPRLIGPKNNIYVLARPIRSIEKLLVVTLSSPGTSHHAQIELLLRT
jgi:hypothetical protein